jgi:penicillin-binding protein 1A
MSNGNDYNEDYERFLNDPEFRRRKLAERKSASEKREHQTKKSSEVDDPKPNDSKTTQASGRSDEPATSMKTRKKKSSEHGSTSLLPFMLKWSGGIILAGLVAGTVFMQFLLLGLPSIEELENPKTDMASFVMSRDGQVLDKYFTENRTWVSYVNISPYVIDALIAVEDHRFYQHWGIDLYRTAAVPYYLLQGNVQGGSTITQQLARNLYKKIGREVTVIRKLREMLTAIQIERNYTKREIIEMYLNTVEYSNSSFGIEAAAFTHYSKTAMELNLNEAATLVGSLNAVTAFNPRTNPERSTRRRNIVLSQMERRGYITRDVYETTFLEPIELQYNPPFRARRQSRYFGEYVRLQIQQWADDNGYDLFRDGLVIYTTVDANMQRIAETAVRAQIDSLQPIFQREWTSPRGSYMDRYFNEFPGFLDQFIEDTDEYKNGFSGGKTRREVLDSLKADATFLDRVKRSRTKLQGSFVALDPRNGHVLAWVGGTDYGVNQFDHVFLSRKQAGSTFKPFVYALAIDNGYKPYHRFSRYPISFINRQNEVWAPRDATISPGPEMVTLSEGLARSLNNVTIRLLPELAGAPGTNRLEDLLPAGRRIAEMARNLGINKSPLISYPSIALGTADVTLLEVTSAYATFANQGVYIEPTAVTRIEDKNGNILVEYFPQKRMEVLSPETAYIMIDMMRGAIRGGDWGFGTAVRLRNMGVNQDVAGKTGTTQNSTDNWFIAVMPHIAMGAWVGGDDRRIRFPTNNPNSVGQGARAALPIVGRFIIDNNRFNAANWSRDGFEQPAGFVLDFPDSERQQDIEQRNTRRTGW